MCTLYIPEDGFLGFEITLCLATRGSNSIIESVTCKQIDQDGRKKVDDWLDLKKSPLLSEWKRVPCADPEDTICSFRAPSSDSVLCITVSAVGEMWRMKLFTSDYLL